MVTTKNVLDDFPFPFSLHDRVTTVLAPFSGMDKIPADVLANAAKRGTEVHQIIECIQEGLPHDIPEHLLGYVDSYDAWAKDKKFISKPGRMYCDDLMITGELDCLINLDGRILVVDFKTSVAESKTWKYQGAAYGYLAKKGGYNVQGCVFVRLQKDGKEAKENCYTIYPEIEGFKRLLEVYREFFAGTKADMGDF